MFKGNLKSPQSWSTGVILLGKYFLKVALKLRLLLTELSPKGRNTRYRILLKDGNN